MNDTRESFPEEIFAWLAGDRTPRVAAVVRGWMEATGETEETLRAFAPVGRPTEPVRAPDGWTALERRLDGLEADPPRLERARRGAIRGWGGLSAAAVLLLALGLGLLWPRVRSASAPQQHARIVVPAGSHASVELPGGVRVKLGYASTLSYLPAADVREVQLEGEAYFSVPQGDRRNLLVHTEAGVVRDLGTEFSVRARSGRTSVAVTTGAVRLETGLGAVDLGAGESSSVEVGRPPEPAARVDAATPLDWVAGRLVFYQMPLARVAEELALRYGVPFHVDPALADVRITASIALDTGLAEAAEGICLSIQARCTTVGDTWRISP